MFLFAKNVYGDKSASPMLWHGLGLTLSYSFLR